MIKEETNFLKESKDKIEERHPKYYAKLFLFSFLFLNFIMKEIILKAPEIKAAMDFFNVTGLWSWCFIVFFILLSIR